MIRLLLAEDQALVRGALAALLNLEPDIEVVAEAGDGAQAWEAVKRIQPDVVVTDIEMPGMTGIDLAMRVRDSGMPTRVVIVTTFGRAGYLRRAMDAGVRGYLIKDEPAGQLAEALRQVGLGHRLGHRPHQVSGGEKQRTAIARALARQPALLLADEPTGALDSVSGEGVVQLLLGLHGQGTAVVVITHDRDLAARFDRQVSMRDGELVEDRRRTP